VNGLNVPKCSAYGIYKCKTRVLNALWTMTFLNVKVMAARRAGTYASLSIYIKLKSHPSVCLSVTLITRMGLLVSTHQVPNTKRSSSACSKFVTTSSCVLPFTVQSELNAKV